MQCVFMVLDYNKEKKIAVRDGWLFLHRAFFRGARKLFFQRNPYLCNYSATLSHQGGLNLQ